MEDEYVAGYLLDSLYFSIFKRKTQEKDIQSCLMITIALGFYHWTLKKKKTSALSQIGFSSLLLSSLFASAPIPAHQVALDTQASQACG